jgi:N-acetylglucosaminyl-diphospho-decaprenol L-rhamnosyltransferase
VPLSATVIVPSRGPAARLRRLLDSLAAQTVEHETIVIDNGSGGGDVTALCEGYPTITPIRLERNAGFSAAVNLGAAQASGGALVLVNDDCVLDPGFVGEIVAALDPDAGVTMAAGVLRDARRPDLIDTAGLRFDRTLLASDYLNGTRLADLRPGIPAPDGPSGAAAAFDRVSFATVGGFDEALFAYWEDTDLALRLIRAGSTCRLAPGAVGTHEHSATLGAGSAAKNRLTGFGRGYVLRKWGVLTPRRLLPVLVREAGILAGQAIADRNLAGLRGRVAGWRAAEPSESYPRLPEPRGADSLAGLLRSRRRRRGLGAP